jgi:hypothetical protein
VDSFTTLGGHHRFRWSDIAPHLPAVNPARSSGTLPL